MENTEDILLNLLGILISSLCVCVCLTSSAEDCEREVIASPYIVQCSTYNDSWQSETISMVHMNDGDADDADADDNEGSRINGTLYTSTVETPTTSTSTI